MAGAVVVCTGFGTFSEMVGRDDEELERGYEQCPICSRVNCPGAMDHCGHYFGNYWDGQIIWSDRFNQFESRWSDLQTLVDDEADGDELERCRKLARRRGVGRQWFSPEVWEAGTSFALMALLDFEQGPLVVTGGMLGGAGSNLYLPSMDGFDELLRQLDAFIAEFQEERPAEGGGR